MMPPQADASLALEYSTDTRKLEWEPTTAVSHEMAGSGLPLPGPREAPREVCRPLGVSRLPAALTRT